MMKRAVIQVLKDLEIVSSFKRKPDLSTGPIDIFSFSTNAEMLSVLTPKRWALIEHLQKIGPSTASGLARSLRAGAIRVKNDLAVLVDLGIVERSEGRKVFIPYVSIRADFVIRAAAYSLLPT